MLLVLIIAAYFNGGCGACANGAACDGLFGECVCTGNHLGEYCGESCGDFGQVNGSACVCSGNRTGAFCELDALGGGATLESTLAAFDLQRLVPVLAQEDIRDVETLALLEAEDLRAMGIPVGTRSKLARVIQTLQV